jgi:hypothetical protein
VRSERRSTAVPDECEVGATPLNPTGTDVNAAGAPARGALRPPEVLTLQRTFGNHAVARLLATQDLVPSRHRLSRSPPRGGSMKSAMEGLRVAAGMRDAEFYLPKLKLRVLTPMEAGIVGRAGVILTPSFNAEGSVEVECSDAEMAVYDITIDCVLLTSSRKAHYVTDKGVPAGTLEELTRGPTSDGTSSPGTFVAGRYRSSDASLLCSSSRTEFPMRPQESSNQSLDRTLHHIDGADEYLITLLAHDRPFKKDAQRFLSYAVHVPWAIDFAAGSVTVHGRVGTTGPDDAVFTPDVGEHPRETRWLSAAIP